MLSSAGIGPLCDAIASSPPLAVDLCLTNLPRYFKFIFHLHDFLHSKARGGSPGRAARAHCFSLGTPSQNQNQEKRAKKIICVIKLCAL